MLSARPGLDNEPVGLFSLTVKDEDGGKLGCARYVSRANFDRMFVAARAFGVLTAMCCVLSLLCITTSIMALPKQTILLWTSSQYILMVATVTQMFTFFALGSNFLCSDHDCKLTGVGSLAAFNVACLGALSIGLYLESAPVVPWFTWWEDEQELRGRAASLSRMDPALANFMAEQKNTTPPSINVESVQEAPPPTEVHMGAEDDSASSASSFASILGVKGLRIFRLVVLALFIFFWAVSVTGAQRCSFMTAKPQDSSSSSYGLGLFTQPAYAEDGSILGCVAYPDAMKDTFDPPFLAARVFGAVAAMLATIVLLINLLLLFVNVAKEEAWFVVRLLMPCATVCQLLAFTAYKTRLCQGQMQCVPGQLGVWVILNVILSVVMSVLIFLMPCPPHPLFGHYRPGRTAARPNRDDSTAEDSALPVVPVIHTSQQLNKKKKRFLVDPRSLHLLKRKDAAKKVADECTAADSHPVGRSEHAERIIRIDPLPHSASEDEAELITVTVEYSSREKRIVKTVTHPDGSKTITTTIEELDDDDYFEDQESGSVAISEYDNSDDAKREAREEELDDVPI